MISTGTQAVPQNGTEIDFTTNQNKEMEIGKVYSAYFQIGGVLSGGEQQIMDSIFDQIVYPTGHPEANERCSPTYIMVDSALGIAYAEWIVNPTTESNPMIAPLLAFVIIGAILIVLGILIYINLGKATEFVAAGKDNPLLWTAILCAAGAVVLVAGAYAYGKIISDKPIMRRN